MSASVRGDFARLRKLVAGMGKLNTPAFRRETNTLLAEEMLARVQMGFENSVDPYGRSWAPLKYRVGKPLIDTSLLRNSIHYRVNRSGFVVFTNVKYAAFHQFGGRFSRKARTNAHDLDSGRFIKQSLKGTRSRAAGYRSPSTRVSFSKGYEFTATRRQFLPDADRLPRKYRLGFERVLNAQRVHYLGR